MLVVRQKICHHKGMNLEGEVQAYYTVVKGEKQGNHAQFTRPPPLNVVVPPLCNTLALMIYEADSLLKLI